jgi:hypothetical protein
MNQRAQQYSLKVGLAKEFSERENVLLLRAGSHRSGDDERHNTTLVNNQ